MVPDWLGNGWLAGVTAVFNGSKQWQVELAFGPAGGKSGEFRQSTETTA